MPDGRQGVLKFPVTDSLRIGAECSCCGTKTVDVSFSTGEFSVEFAEDTPAPTAEIENELLEKAEPLKPLEKEEEMITGNFISAIFSGRDGEYTPDAKVYYYEIATLNGLAVGDKIKVLTNARVTQHLSDVDSVSMGTIKKDPYGDSWIKVLEIFRDVSYKCMPTKLEALSALGAWSRIVDYDIKKEERFISVQCPDGTVTTHPYDVTDLYVKTDDVHTLQGGITSGTRLVFKNGQSIDVIKEEKSVSMKKLMGDFMFGKVDTNTIKYSFNGIAFKAEDGVTYNVYNADGTITNVSDMVMDIPVFAMPVSKAQLAVGDVILHPADRTPLIVKENAETAIIAVEPKSNEIKTFAPKKSIFGFDFYTKIMTPMDMFGGANANADNPFGNMLPFLMMGDGNTDMSTMLMFTMMNGANGGAMDMNAMLPFLMLSDKSGGDNKDFLMAMLMAKGFGVQKDSGSKPNEN